MTERTKSLFSEPEVGFVAGFAPFAGFGFLAGENFQEGSKRGHFEPDVDGWKLVVRRDDCSTGSTLSRDAFDVFGEEGGV